jgi:hypothetical protein
MIFISSCSYEKIEKETPAVNDLKPNTKYRINLPEEHNSGYIWQLSDGYDRSVIENTSAVWHGNTKGVDHNFLTKAAGTTTLTFILRKYTDTSDIKQFVVQINP